ncbi:MAG: DNA-processing protein DprA [Rhodomicrobiaceae bacterium]
MALEELEASPGTARGAGTIRLSDEEKLAWIRLIRTENIGPITFHELIAHLGSASAALDAIPELCRRGGTCVVRQRYPRELAEREWEAAENAGARILAFPETDYPPLLKQIAAAPPILYAKGRPEFAAGNTVAIVGSRNASAVGRQFASEIARDLGRGGAVVVSGLARGIDTAAHEGALASGTIAVVAGGIDVVYPPENTRLQNAIAERGLILTECPPGFAPRGQDFPRRNRIISGVSSGVIVIEAAQKSGSLITARLALEQNREVFAVPGHPLDPRASGTNGLISSGAHLVTSADDVLSELFTLYRRAPLWRELGNAAAWISEPEPVGAERAGRDRETVLGLLSLAPVHPDMLLRQSSLSPRRLAVALLELDLAGRIDRHDDERISLKLAQIQAE